MFYICIATLFLPYPVILVALFDIFGKLPSFGLQGAKSWVDTFLPLIVPAFFANPFYIFLMRQFMLGIPKELSDAARVDGASEIQTFWKVILPLTKPAIVVVAIFAAVGAWNEFLLPLLYLQDNSKYPLAVGLAFFTSEHDVAYNLLMAASDADRAAGRRHLHLRAAVLRRGHHGRRRQGLNVALAPPHPVAPPDPHDTQPIAVVGGRPIPMSRLERRLRGGPPRPAWPAPAARRRLRVGRPAPLDRPGARDRGDPCPRRRPRAAGVSRFDGDAVAYRRPGGARHVTSVTVPRARRARLLRAQSRPVPAPGGAPGPAHPDARRGLGPRGSLAGSRRARTWAPWPRRSRSTPAAGRVAASWATSIGASSAEPLEDAIFDAEAWAIIGPDPDRARLARCRGSRR